MICNYCGKELDEIENINTGNIMIPFFYGSKRDGDKVQLSLCSECYDEIVERIEKECKIKPTVFEMID